MAHVPAARRWRGSRWLLAAAGVVVAAFFAKVLRDRWQQVHEVHWRLAPGWLALSSALLALSYAMVALLWAGALRATAGRPRLARGVAIWFASNLARYVPGNLWSFVGAVELARREQVPRRVTLGVMALTQALSVGVALAVGLPVLVAERQRYGRLALAAGAVLLALALLALLARRPLGALLRRRYPDVRLRELVPGPRGLLALVIGYAAYWLVTGIAFAAFIRAIAPLHAGDVPLVVAAYAAAYAIGFLSLLAPAGLGVRESILVIALAPLMATAPALVVAVVSRLWTMLLELGGALVAYGVDARLREPAAGDEPAPTPAEGA